MTSMGGHAGRRKGPSSPSSSTHLSPSLPPTSLPRLKLSLRNTPTPPIRSQPKQYTSQQGYASNNASSSRRAIFDDSDSDLTPEEDDDDDVDVHDEPSAISPRMSKKEKGKGADHTPINKNGTKGSTKKAVSAVKKAAKDNKKTTAKPDQPKVSAAGPGGRDRKRALKVGELERRRQRDEKFDVNSGDAYSATPSRTRRSPPDLVDSDSESSYGDDESDHDSLMPSFGGFDQPTFGFGQEGMQNDIDMETLPTAFAGQEIEDLAYGGGRPEFDMERQVLSGLWEDDEDEDEELFISQLSGSEVERGSESSVHESDSDESSMEESSTSDDDVDEFGFPRPTMAAPSSSEEGPLVLMENWDGQFVLVQPRQERSRSRRRGSRGSRTNGSVGGSTILSGTDQQALIIDADADCPSSSEWSGMSDEENGGDTTDSMAEEDMPMLDSPALDMIIEEQMANIMGSMNGMPNGFHAPPSPTPVNGAPSIVITDPTGTPSMTESGLQTPANLPAPPAGSAVSGGDEIHPINGTMPQTPNSMPQMGTFHSTSDDPAQHAVIDGSKIPTKSPFTHGRRSRRGRSNSVSTNNTERKRKSSTTASIAQPFNDPFFPTTLPKRARYSSIPGHPRFVAAKRQQERERMALLEGDEETSDEAEIDLEDMLETEIMAHDSAAASHHPHSAGFRFDRVPVSTYLRRNFGGGGNNRRDEETFSSPVQARSFMSLGMGMDLGQYASMNNVGLGMGMGGMDGWGLDDTLAGPPQRMMLVSPNLPALGEEGDAALSRKERRRRKRLGGNGMGLTVSSTVPPLQI